MNKWMCLWAVAKNKHLIVMYQTRSIQNTKMENGQEIY